MPPVAGEAGSCNAFAGSIEIRPCSANQAHTFYDDYTKKAAKVQNLKKLDKKSPRIKAFNFNKMHFTQTKPAWTTRRTIFSIA